MMSGDNGMVTSRRRHHESGEEGTECMTLIEAMEKEIGFTGALPLVLTDAEFNLSSSNPHEMLDWIRSGFKKVSANDLAPVTLLLDLSKTAIHYYMRYDVDRIRESSTSLQRLVVVALTSSYVQLNRAQEQIVNDTSSSTLGDHHQHVLYYRVIRSSLSLFINICYDMLYDETELLVTYDIHRSLQRIMRTIIEENNQNAHLEGKPRPAAVVDDDGDDDEESMVIMKHYAVAMSAYMLIEPRQFATDIAAIITRDDKTWSSLMPYLYPCYYQLSVSDWASSSGCIMGLLNIATTDGVWSKDNANILLAKACLSDEVFIPDSISYYNNVTDVNERTGRNEGYNGHGDDDDDIFIERSGHHLLSPHYITIKPAASVLDDGTTTTSSSMSDNTIKGVKSRSIDSEVCDTMMKWVISLIEAGSYTAAAGLIVRMDKVPSSCHHTTRHQPDDDDDDDDHHYIEDVDDTSYYRISASHELLEVISNGLVYSLIQLKKDTQKGSDDDDDDEASSFALLSDYSALTALEGLDIHLKCIGILIQQERLILGVDEKDLLLNYLTTHLDEDDEASVIREDNDESRTLKHWIVASLLNS